MEFLGALTILAGTPFLLYLVRVLRRNRGTRSPFYGYLFAVLALTVSVATSYDILLRPPVLPGYWRLLSPFVLFLLSVLVKLLIILYLAFTVSGLFQPGRILKFGAKVPGFEISNELGPLDRALTQAERDYELITNLNETVLEYVASAYEESILTAEDPAEEIRRQTEEVLQSVYKDYPGTAIRVVPCTKEGIASLWEPVATLVRKWFDRKSDLSTVEGDALGIGIHHGTEGFTGAIIVIDASRGRGEVTAAEIYAASTLYIAIASTIGAALVTRD
ncbi:MAG: hypothetical protein GX493_03465 [Firmicutes bacterium]|nr:hypothetical protein [Bacillota bacterium]